MYSGWKQNKWLRNVLGEETNIAKYRNVFAKFLQRVLEKRDKGDRNVNCLLDVLLADGELSQEEIMSTLVGFIVLGYDRLSSSTCLVLVKIARSMDLQQKLREDIKLSIEFPGAEKRMLSLGKLIFETQRLHPAVPVLSKWITEGIPLNGFFIPPETSVFLYLEGTSRATEHFSNLDKFDENRKHLSDTFDGQRQNLPMTVMKAVLGNLVAKYQLGIEEEDVEMGCGVSLRFTGARVSFKSQS